MPGLNRDFYRYEYPAALPSDNHQHYPIAENALATLRRRGELLCIAPQNLIEFWSVATRPQDENGLGMAYAKASSEVTALKRLFHVLPYKPEVLEVWQMLVSTVGVSGKQTHDAHLVAMMKVHSATSILTFNGDHFKRYPGIIALDPSQV